MRATSERIVLITGANRGIGRETARHLAGRGFHVVLGVRKADYIAEMFNTALEHLVDHLHPEIHPRIGVVKDCAAAGVLMQGLQVIEFEHGLSPLAERVAVGVVVEDLNHDRARSLSSLGSAVTIPSSPPAASSC